MNRKEYDTPKGKAVFEYDGNGVGQITLECMDMLMDMVASSMWIPCSEGLPEEHEWIGTKKFGTTISDKVHITFDVNGKRFVKTLSLQNGQLSISDKQRMDAFHKGWKMLAWMPLPEPWKGATND